MSEAAIKRKRDAEPQQPYTNLFILQDRGCLMPIQQYLPGYFTLKNNGGAVLLVRGRQNASMGQV
jgi:hypothetical protein